MISISWSLIDSYFKCPLRVQYQLEHRQRGISWAMAYANAGHKALAAWAHNEDWLDAYEQACSEYGRRTARVSDWNGEFTDPDPTGAIVQKAQIKDLLKKYINGMIGKPDGKLVELPLSKDLGNGVILSGRVDALWDGVIVDWKFISSPKYLSPIQAIIYAVLNGGPSEFRYDAMVKARNPYWESIPIPETKKQENLDRAIEHVIKPVARVIESGVFYARPDEFLCKKQYCGYWKECEGRFV